MPFVDPDFKTRMVRITDAQAQWNSRLAVPAYPTTQAWNCDETLFILYVSGALGSGGVSGGFALFDGKTYDFIQLIAINPADVEQFYWSTSDPSALFYVDNSQRTGTQVDQLVKATISPTSRSGSGSITAVSLSITTIHDFTPDLGPGGVLSSALSGKSLSGIGISGGGDPFAMSLDNDLIGLGVNLNTQSASGAEQYTAFSYRLSTGVIGKPFAAVGTVPQALPSGRATYFYQGTGGVTVLDPLSGSVRLSLPFNGQEHSDMLRNAAGDDIVAGAQYDAPTGGAVGTLIWADLIRGGVHTLIGPANGDPYPPSGTLVSGRAYKAPGWVAVGIVGCPSGSTGTCNGAVPTVSGTPMTYLDQEVLIASVDTGSIYRVAHHRSAGYYANASVNNYWAQPNVSMSPSGTRILVQSDWGSANPSAPIIDPNAVIDTYVIELPSYKA